MDTIKRLFCFAILAFPTALLGVAAPDKPLAIPAGSILRIRLETTLTDKTNKTGDRFTGVVTDPIVVNGTEVVSKFSIVNGRVAFVKPSGRIRGKAQMRIVIENLTTPDNLVYPLSSTLEDTHGGVCGDTAITGKSKPDEEGTITGCGKSKKQAAKAAAIAGAIGAAAGASVGIAGMGGCNYYGCYPGSSPNIGADIGYGAGIGAGTALVYTLLKHEKHIVLVQGTELIFSINRSTSAEGTPTTAQSMTR